MPRLTRNALNTESPEPTRRSSRASTQASSTSSQATPPPAPRGRSRSKRGATGDAGDGEEKPVEKPETEKSGRGRSQSRKKVETNVAEEQKPRGKKETPQTPKRGRSKTPGGRKGKAAKVEDVQEPEEADEVGDVKEELDLEPEPVEKAKRRTKAKAPFEDSPKPPITTSPTSRGRRGRPSKGGSPATSTPPAKTASRRGRKSDVQPDTDISVPELVAPITKGDEVVAVTKAEEVVAVTKTEEVVAVTKAEAAVVAATKAEAAVVAVTKAEEGVAVTKAEEVVAVTKPEEVVAVTKPEEETSSPEVSKTSTPFKSSETHQTTLQPEPKTSSSPVKKPDLPLTEKEHMPHPFVEPITPESETAEPEPTLPSPAIEDVSPMETEPVVLVPAPVPATTTQADQTPSSGGTKRKLEEADGDEVDEPSSKRQNIVSEDQSNEAMPAMTTDVEMFEPAPIKPDVNTLIKPDDRTSAIPTQSEPVSQSSSQTSEAEAKTDVEDFVIISHADVPPANSQEIQKSLPNSQVESTVSVPVKTPVARVSSASEVSTSEAEAAPSLPVKSASTEAAVSSQMDFPSIQTSQNPMVEDVSPVESSMDSNIGSYGDDKEAVAPQASAADSNVSSQSAEVDINTHLEPVTDSNANEAIPQQNNSYNCQPVSQPIVSQSEPVTSSQATSNGVNNTTNLSTSPKKTIDHFEPKLAPTSAFLSNFSSDIFHRHYLSNPALTSPVDKSRQFSLVSYNILADCAMKKGDYSYTEEKYLDQTYRHNLLIRELKSLDGDIVCLQEVNPNYFNTLLKPEMEGLGYIGSMHKRCQDSFDEGEATFYKSSRFSLEEQKGYSLKDLADREVLAGGLSDEVQTAVRKYLDRADVLHLSRLRCLHTGKIITVGNIHVVWNNFKSPDVQCIQIASAVKEIVSKAGNDTSPFLFCGDFNSEITSPGYQLARDGYLSDTNIQKLQSLENLETTDGSKSLLNHLWRAFQHTASNLKSAYCTVQGQEPTLTSFTAFMHSAVDYIFYNGNSLNVDGVLQVVHEQVIEKTCGMPTAQFPSDHVSLKAVFNFKE
ncbi:mucin-2 [Patella vulgata]|uniref:mucin-2 n=1 Tax=Patella vulgata TaxID=6465 RepID=UPI0024A7DCC8|nr:mucin-2 [Patella vulgata]XP_050392255.2 mucin-2 [Patella vulgata]XP_050392256.2 mucin-2 [Patella vulgata]XP_055954717.1 mucin-2 [Patella vulgata]